MATELMQTSEASTTTTFKNDALEVSYFILNEQSLCKILKDYDDESAGNVILILSLEMENNVFKLSKQFVVI
jgi:hypothetical protein